MNSFVQNLVMTVPPAEEPVSLATAKSHLRVGSAFTNDDALIGIYISAARKLCEKESRRAFVTRTYELRLNRFPPTWPMAYLPGYSDERRPGGTMGEILVPKPPLIAVDSITYLDNNGTLQTLDPSLYLVDSGGTLQGAITPSFGTVWPQTRYQLDAVKITYDAGYGAQADVEPAAVLAMLLLIGSWYRNREAVTPTTFTKLTLGAESLLSTLNWGFYG